jgi:hypothetical protein
MAYVDVEGAFRKAVFDALNQAVIVNAVTLPVYDEFAADDAPNLFIVLGNQYPDDKRTYQKWITGQVIIIDIVHHQNRGMTKDVVDEVAGKVKELLMPDIYTVGITIDPPLSINNFYRESSSYLSEQNNTKWILRKIERYRCNIQQD